MCIYYVARAWLRDGCVGRCVACACSAPDYTTDKRNCEIVAILTAAPVMIAGQQVLPIQLTPLHDDVHKALCFTHAIAPRKKGE